MKVNNRRFRRRQGWLTSGIQLFFALLVCVLVPLLFFPWNLPLWWQEPQSLNAAAAASIGITFGFWLHRNFGELPGTWESSGILPGYSLSFGVAFIVILMFRVEYSRAILLGSFLLAVTWFFAVYLFTQRKADMRLGIVKGGNVGEFANLDGVQCVPVTLEQWPDDVDAIAADFRCDHDDAWQAQLTAYVLTGIPVYHSKDLHESLTGRANLEHLSENHFGTLGPQTSLLTSKSVLDRIIALPVLIFAMPLFILIAIAIKLDSKGPVLFRQPRVGFRGYDFDVQKFRTMVVHDSGETEADAARFITNENDARITRVGRFLRRTRLDELPQVINILRGEMSWIGPRPEAAMLSRWYQEEIPFYRYRHVVRPGITGWAQVNQGHVTDIHDIKTKLQYDFYYIRNFSIWLEMLILMKTIKTMLTGFGHR
jgi:lipopolysaccharide/colanic/teichoic acid biosynthesis glycosyltransferase